MEPIASNDNELNNDNVTDKLTLLCLCNDNTECISKPAPDESVLPSSSSKLGHCVTTTNGRCYTVRDVTTAAFRNIPDAKLMNDAKPGATQLEQFESDDFNTEKYIHVRYGCLSSPSKITFSCNGHLTNHLVPKTIACCNSSDYCNAMLLPEFQHHPSDQDAVRAALRNRHQLNQDIRQHRPIINREFNLGPHLLNGGELVFGSGHQSQSSLDTTNPNILKIFNIVLVVAFSCILAILLILSIVMFICYKRRLRKQKNRVCESLLLYSAVNSNGHAGCLPSSVVNSWIVEEKTRKADVPIDCSKSAKQRDHCVPSACSSQTMSSHLTRNAESCGDIGLQQSGLRSMGKQVTLEKLVGTGRFSDVWQGTWRGEQIVAKVFLTNDRLTQAVWRRTTSIYRSVLLRHCSIQSLMAVDWIYYPSESHQAVLKDRTIVSPSLHAMLISEPYQWGTLKDLMSRYRWRSCRTTESLHGANAVEMVYTLSSVEERSNTPILTTTDELFMSMILRMAMSLTRGLCFLHSELAGTRGKPALAHRDLKTSNVLVRSDWTLCIGDLGFCVRPPPNPLPIPLSELNQLYAQYTAQLYQTEDMTNALTTSLVSSDHTPSTYLAAKPQFSEDVSMSRSFESSQCKGHRPASLGEKFTLDKAELLDWWPAGGMQIGTPRYMAPELLNNSAAPFSIEGHQKADIYSLSLVLWELIAWALHKSWTGTPVGDFENTWPHWSSQPYTSCHKSPRGSPNSSAASSYVPAYQTEWDDWLRGRLSPFDSQSEPPTHTAPMLQSLVDTQPSQTTSTTEPDLWTMRHLVCDLNHRPRLPTASECEPQQHLVPEAAPLISFRPHNTVRTKSEETEDFPYSDTTQPGESAGTLLAVASSSSGASSIDDAQTKLCQTTHYGSDRSGDVQLQQLHHTVLTQYAKLLGECWVANPDSRLTALRIRKTLQRMIDQVEESCRVLNHNNKPEQPKTAVNVNAVCAASPTPQPDNHHSHEARSQSIVESRAQL